MLVCLGTRRCGLERGGVACCAAVRHATRRGVLRFAAVRCGMVWPERGETPAAKKEKEAGHEQGQRAARGWVPQKTLESGKPQSQRLDSWRAQKMLRWWVCPERP